MRWQLPRGQIIGFGLIIVLVVGLAVYALFELNEVLTSQVLSDRVALASLSASVLSERFDRLTDLSTSLATRVSFREQIEAGHWEEAITILAAVPKDFPYVDRIFLTDPGGVLRADVPPAAGVRGDSFAYRDWYQGVTARNAPYVSNVYQRAAEPEPKVIAVAAPVVGSSDPTKTTAFLVFQVRLDTLLEWAQEADYGPDAYAVFVDRNGVLAAHPKFDPQGELVDFSMAPWVQAASRTDQGIGAYYDPLTGEEGLVAFARVSEYGWTVGISQGIESAFATRDRILTGTRILFAIVVALIGLLVASIIRAFSRLQMAKNEFIVTATHQLKTPLVGLRWTLDSLRIPPEVLSEQQRTYLANLERFGDMMVRSVDELLDVSRIELGTLQIEIAEVDTREMLDRLVADMGYYATVRGHSVSLSVADDVPHTIAADRRMVYHVLQNLVSNAIDYSMTGTTVEVRAMRAGDELRVEVENQGDSIPPEALQHLFEKFYRAPEAKRVKAVGTGIGLYIAKSFVQRWGGRIGFTSAAGKTVFGITVPLNRSVQASDSKPHLSSGIKSTP